MKRKRPNGKWGKNKKPRTDWQRAAVPVDFHTDALIFQMTQLDYTVVDSDPLGPNAEPVTEIRL